MKATTSLPALGALVAAGLMAGGLVAGVLAPPAAAQSVLEDWSKVKADAAPVPKPATADAKTTALLVMDLLKQTCNAKRPQCLASIPKIEALIADAKAKGITVIWTMFPGPKPADYLPAVAPPAGTKFLVALADKFINSDLDQELKAKGIKTVITVGTVAEGAVLYTASDAAMRGYNVVVPIEGMSSGSLYGEQVAVWALTHAPTVAQHVTLTRLDMITYR